MSSTTLSWLNYFIKEPCCVQGLIEKRVGPWINKKIMEYIGEQEPVLTEFICNKLSCHISPEDILNDISMVGFYGRFLSPTNLY